MSADLVNVAGGDRLGMRQFFRIVFEADALGGYFGSAFNLGANRTYAAIDRTGLVFPLSTLAVLPGQLAAVVDVRTTDGGAGRSVADLVTALEALDNLTRVRSIERVSVQAVTGSAAGGDRQRLQDRESDERDAESPGFDDVVKRLKMVALVVLLVAGLAGLVYVGKLKHELVD